MTATPSDMPADVEHKWADMLAGIVAQPGYLRDGAAHACHASATLLDVRVPSRVYLVGCGDSHYAGLATRFAFERWSGIPTEAMEAFEFARYAGRDAPRDALVIAVSNSGRAARTVECVRLANERGIASVGLTHNPTSPLAHTATMLLPSRYDYPGTGAALAEPRFETLSYLASMTGLYALAARLAQLNGRFDEAATSHALGAIVALGDNVASTIAACRDTATWVAENLPAHGQVHVLGGGPNYATALLSMALFIEAALYPASGVEIEEWAHEQYWCTHPGTATLVVAPPGASLDRAREQLQAVGERQGYAVAICAADDAETARLANAVLPIVPPEDELLSPLVTPIPLQLTALAFGKRIERTLPGSEDERRRAVSFRQSLIFGNG